MDSPEPIPVISIPGEYINGITRYNDQFFVILRNSELYTFVDYSLEDYIPIPNANFEQFLIDSGLDTEATLDNQILTTDALAITNLEILEEDNNINDFSGLEWFLNLESFTANHTLATHIDFGELAQLSSINLFQNDLLETIDLRGTSALESITATNNALTILDFSNNLSLADIDVNNNNITALNLTQNQDLVNFNCSSNPMLDLDLRNGRNTFIITYNSTNTPDLNCIYVDDPEYSDLVWTFRSKGSVFVDSDSDCEAAFYYSILDINFEQFLIDQGIDSEGILDNRLLITDANTTTEITIVDPDNEIFSFSGLENFANLVNFTANQTNASVIDFGNLSSLVSITLQQNTNLASINIVELANLKSLTVTESIVTGVDLSGNLLLENLDCSSNLISDLDLSLNTAILSVNCNINPLVELDIRNGNNTSITSYNSTQTPGLDCIYVDDPIYSETNWLNVDDASTFVANEAECEALSIDEFDGRQIVVYPNPVKDKLNLSAELFKGTSINIYDLTGKLVANFTLGSDSIIDVSSLSVGVYMLTAKSADQTFVSRFIKK